MTAYVEHQEATTVAERPFEGFLSNLSAELLASYVTDLDTGLVRALERVVEFFEAGWGVICESTDPGGALRLACLHVVDEEVDLRPVLLDEGWSGWAGLLQDSGPLWLERDDEIWPSLSAWSELPGRPEVGALAIVPLRVDAHVLGVVFLGSAAPQFEAPADVAIKLSLTGSVFTTALLRQREARSVAALRREAARYARELRTVTTAGQVLISTLDLNAVLSTVVAETRVALRAESAWVMLQEDEDLVWAAAVGPHVEALIGERVPLSEGICGWVMREGQPALVNHAQYDPRLYTEINDLIETKSRCLLAVPLLYRGVPRGVIEAINKAGGLFDEHDLRLMEEIAVPASIAIENARLFAAIDQALIRRERAEIRVRELNRDLEQRAAELAAVNQAGQSISATLELESVLQAVLQAAVDLLQPGGVALLLRVAAPEESEGEELLLAALHPPTDVKPGTRYALEQGFLGLVMSQGEAVIGTQGLDQALPKPLAPMFPGVPVRSVMAVPLVYHGCVEGVIELVNKASGAFDEHDREILEVVAHTAVAAIKNAQLYRHLESALDAEQKARAQLVQAAKLSMVGRMVASIAHELNNPLQTIRNCLFLSQEDVPKGAGGYRYLQMAMDEIFRLGRLVDQLRDVYRPGLADEIRDVSLVELIEQVHVLLAPHFAEFKVVWRFAVPPRPVFVHGLADQLKQVFLNLCLNACDAMKGDGGMMTVEIRRSADGHQVGVSFSDTGSGIPAADLPYLFDPFFTTKEAGMGLGLAICYDIVQRHGGRLEVTSQLGEGTTFTVWLLRAKRSSS